MWIYDNIKREDFLAKINLAETIIEKSGAFLSGNRQEKSSHIDGNGITIDSRNATKKIWNYKNQFICVDELFFREKPFIVLEFSDRPEGPYEDADPFPYDLSEEKMIQEIKTALKGGTHGN